MSFLSDLLSVRLAPSTLACVLLELILGWHVSFRSVPVRRVSIRVLFVLSRLLHVQLDSLPVWRDSLPVRLVL